MYGIEMVAQIVRKMILVIMFRIDRVPLFTIMDWDNHVGSFLQYAYHICCSMLIIYGLTR